MVKKKFVWNHQHAKSGMCSCIFLAALFKSRKAEVGHKSHQWMCLSFCAMEPKCWKQNNTCTSQSPRLRISHVSPSKQLVFLSKQRHDCSMSILCSSRASWVKSQQTLTTWRWDVVWVVESCVCLFNLPNCCICDFVALNLIWCHMSTAFWLVVCSQACSGCVTFISFFLKLHHIVEVVFLVVSPGVMCVVLQMFWCLQLAWVHHFCNLSICVLVVAFLVHRAISHLCISQNDCFLTSPCSIDCSFLGWSHKEGIMKKKKLFQENWVPLNWRPSKEGSSRKEKKRFESHFEHAACVNAQGKEWQS